MNENNIGQFIAELRKKRKSHRKSCPCNCILQIKPSRNGNGGLSCPDISLISPIADILGVTTGELLNGQRNENTDSKEPEKAIDNALIYAEKSVKQRVLSFRNVSTIVFSALMLLGIAVCSICDVAISGKFTWSLYPISSIIFHG